FFLTFSFVCALRDSSSLMRGVSGDGPEGGAGSGVPRLRSQRRLGRLGHRSPGTMTRAARSWLHVLRRKWRGRKRGPEAENRQGRSAERRGVPIARDVRAPRKRPGLLRYISAFTRVLCNAAGQPVPRKHRAPVGAPPTPQF